MTAAKIQSIVKRQQAFFATGRTLNLDWRRDQINVICRMVEDNADRIIAAMKADLGRPAHEAFSSEVAILIRDAKDTVKRLGRWARPEKKTTDMVIWPGRSFVERIPYGVAVIIAPWNYPVSLALSPLIGAVAAGNCAIVKPSEITPNCSKLICSLIGKYFADNFIAAVDGGVRETTALLKEKTDYIFFTGSTAVGRVVMSAAAKNLTPVTLELGGKSPCIVDDLSRPKITARRIAWGKFFNAGQTCIAPDYILVREDLKEALITALTAVVREFYGFDPRQSADFGRIVNKKHFDRLKSYLKEGRVRLGGEFDAAQKYIAPTILDTVKDRARVMEDEIFGPILPVVTYTSADDAFRIIAARPRPLALYVFTNNRDTIRRAVETVPCGNMCVNGAFSQVVSSTLPFGGIGASGMGMYHGWYSYDTFSHKKAVLKRNRFIDITLAYPPYKMPIEKFKKLLNRIM